MRPHSYTTTSLLPRTPEQVLEAVLDVRAWWSGDITGPTRHVGDEFEYRYQDVHFSRLRVTEASAARVAWRVLATRLSFTQDQTEWEGTDIVFDIAEAGDSTRLTFTHDGLVPAFECYDACSQGWTMYAAGSLVRWVDSGVGDPAGDGTPRTPAEEEALRGR